MNSLYLVRIVTHQQVTLYIDREGLVWTEKDLDHPGEEPTYFYDLRIAMERAKQYGGQVVKSVTTFELAEEEE